MDKRGFTLLELMVSVSLLVVVSSLSLTALFSAMRSSALAASKDEMQATLRDVMTALTRELSTAYTSRIFTGSAQTMPNGLLAGIAVSNSGKTLTYQVPTSTGLNQGLPTASQQIVLTFRNEDANNNSVLNSGEDTNNDKTLTRRIERTQGGATTTVGNGNCLRAVRFTLVPGQQAGGSADSSLRIELEASKVFESRGSQPKVLTGALASTIHLNN